MKLSCIVVDDEPLAREGIAKYIEEIDFLELKAVCKNALQANTVIQNNDIDLMFLDIEMPQLNGLDFLKSIQNSPLVILTTAYPQYALESFQYDVIDYLVKPISFERFLQSVNKVIRLVGKKTDKEQLPEEDFIFIKSEKQLIKLTVSDILYVEGMQNYIFFHTATEKIMTLVPLKNLFEFLSEENFLQVHKSFVVAKSKIEAIVGNQILIGEHKIPISVRMRKEVMETLTKNRILKK